MTDAPALTRDVSARITAQVTQQAEIVLSIATAYHPAAERITITVDGEPVDIEEVVSTHGTRLHVLPHTPVGALEIDYAATLFGELPVNPEYDGPADRILYLRPSRYCESDTLAEVAAAEFDGLVGKELLDGVSSWVGQQLAYVSGSSRPTDGAVQTYLARAGVCRDFAHLVIALLRARGVPARLVSVYAPGLQPMDFHAVAEAWLDGEWHVLDATTLAPRTGMVRIATGRDASDTAFLTVHSGRVDLGGMTVGATMSPALPDDDVTQLIALA